MAKTNKKEKVVLTETQIRVDTEKRFRAFNEEVAKISEKHQVVIVPALDFKPDGVRPVARLASTKKYETAENQPAKS